MQKEFCKRFPVLGRVTLSIERSTRVKKGKKGRMGKEGIKEKNVFTIRTIYNKTYNTYK